MKNRVLFLCTHNSARSQMAEGWLRHLAGDRFEAFSAGTEETRVHPLAIEAMREAGINISDQTSKTFDRYLGNRFHSVITVCDSAAASCPTFLHGGERLRWTFRDPSSATGDEHERLAVFRDVRNEIEARIRGFVGSTVTVRPASAEHWTAIEQLLLEASLPLEGAHDHLANFLIAETEGIVSGCAAIEPYGQHGLLRSMAVAPRRRGQGIGELLVRSLVDSARDRNMRSIWLLTTTAAGWFPRFGFVVRNREEAAEAIQVSQEFRGACPASATLMSLDLQ